MKQLPPRTPSNPFAALSDAWIENWAQPWSAWQTWSKLWGTQWQCWFDALAAVPTPWLPALAEGRTRQPAAIDFFLPWMPRVDVRMASPVADAGRDTIHAMLRAAVPAAGLFGALAYRAVGDNGVIDVEPVTPSVKATPVSLVPPTTGTSKTVAPAKRSPRKATGDAKATAVKKSRSAKPAGGAPLPAATPAPAAGVAPASEVKKPKAAVRKAAKPAAAPTPEQGPEGG